MKKIIYLTVLGGFLMGIAVGLLASCGPSKEEIETQKLLAKDMPYKVGNVVYLKPDSCSALITGTEVSFNYNGINDWNNPYVLYQIRDCHGIHTITKAEFIYGLKHR